MPNIQLLHSSDISDVAPAANLLLDGEPAVKIHGDGPRVFIKMADGSVKEFGGVLVDDVTPAAPWDGLIWVEPTAERVNCYYGGQFFRIDAAAVDLSALMVSNGDTGTTGTFFVDGLFTANGDIAIPTGTLTVQAGEPLGKITLTQTAGQPSGGAHGDIVMVYI